MPTGSPEKGDLRSSVENMRPVALYLGDVAGCIFIALAVILSLPMLFFIVAMSYIMMLLCIFFTIPDPIFAGVPELTQTFSSIQGDGNDGKEGYSDEPRYHTEGTEPIKGPNWWLFKYYIWNRAVIFIFLANMMNSLFNSIVGSDQIILLDMSEVRISSFLFFLFFVPSIQSKLLGFYCYYYTAPAGC